MLFYRFLFSKRNSKKLMKRPAREGKEGAGGKVIDIIDIVDGLPSAIGLRGPG
jgi:hypothetical protein